MLLCGQSLTVSWSECDMLGRACKPRRDRRRADIRSMSGTVCEVLDELTCKEPDGDWSLSTMEAFCKQHVGRLWGLM